MLTMAQPPFNTNYFSSPHAAAVALQADVHIPFNLQLSRSLASGVAPAALPALNATKPKRKRGDDELPQAQTTPDDSEPVEPPAKKSKVKNHKAGKLSTSERGTATSASSTTCQATRGLNHALCQSSPMPTISLLQSSRAVSAHPHVVPVATPSPSAPPPSAPGQGQPIWHCPYTGCHKTGEFGRPGSFDRHKKAHWTKYMCIICQHTPDLKRRTLSRRDAVVRHLRIKHDEHPDNPMHYVIKIVSLFVLVYASFNPLF